MRQTQTLYIKISLKPHEVFQNIESNILKYLNKHILNKCVSNGYIQKIHGIAQRDKLKISNEQFDGNIMTNVWYTADIINYKENDIICNLMIERIDKFGIHLSKDNHISVFIESKYLPNDYMEQLQKGEKLNIIVLTSQYDLNSDKIKIIGKRIHNYNLYPIKEHKGVLNMHEIVNNLALKLNVEKGKKELIKSEKLGYNTKIDDILLLINEIDENVLNFYIKLLHSFQVIECDKTYTKKCLYDANVDFFKMYEILNEYKLLPTSLTDALTFVCDNKDVIESITEFRKTYFNKKDKYYNNKKMTKDAYIIYVEPNNMIEFINVISQAIRHQKLEGHFIIKMNAEIYNIIYAELLYVLSQYYKQTNIFKPYVSKNTSDEVFIIFETFLGINKVDLKLFDNLEKIELAEGEYIIKLFDNSPIDENFMTNLYNFNTRMIEWKYSKYAEIMNLYENIDTPNAITLDSSDEFGQFYECQIGIAHGYIELLNLHGKN